MRLRKGYWGTIEADFHWHLEILLQVFRVTGFEWASGFFYQGLVMHLPRRLAEPIGAVASVESIAVKMNSEPLPGSLGHILGGGISLPRAA